MAVTLARLSCSLLT